MDNIVDWLTFGLSALCTVGSFWAWRQARKEKQAAAESEKKAKEYQKNADAKNQSAKKYYEDILKLTDTQTRALIFKTRYELLSEITLTFGIINALLDENEDLGMETDLLIDVLLNNYDKTFEQEAIEFRICVQSLCNRVECLFQGIDIVKINDFLFLIYKCKHEDSFDETNFIKCYHGFSEEYNKIIIQTKL